MNQNARLIKQKNKIMNTFSWILAAFQSVIIGGIIKTLQPWASAPIVINACQPEWASPTAFVFPVDGMIQAHQFYPFHMPILGLATDSKCQAWILEYTPIYNKACSHA